MLNVLIHPSAFYYKLYICAFLMRNFKNVTILNAETIPLNTVIHCIFIHIVPFEQVQKYVTSPFTRIVAISGEPCCMFLPFANLIVDCKTDPALRSDNISNIYLPFYVTSCCERLTHPRELLKQPNEQYDLKLKTKFCAYMYSNPVPYREAFFDAVAKYKQPYALGRCKSSEPSKPTTRMMYDLTHKTYLEDAIELYRPYKFVISMENNRIRGYMTEKLANPYFARCVPIYLGPPNLFEDGVLNRKSMIHIDDFPSYDACVDHIKKVDQDDTLYLQYLREPMFVGNKLPRYFDPDYLLKPFLQIFGQ